MTEMHGTRTWSSGILQEIWQHNGAARAALLREIEGLSPGQLAFRPQAGSWSISEILDHLCLAERSMTRAVSRLLQHAAGLGQIGEPGAMPLPSHGIDFEIYNRFAGAPESVLPSPDRPLERLLSGLRESRERLEEVMARADGRVVGNVTLPHFQLGELNFYQWLELEGAHEGKHLQQIHRIKAHPAFPRA